MLYRWFTSLRRVTSKGDFIPEIDGLRFLAILPVVLMHANTNYKREYGGSVDLGLLNQLFNRGGLGVWVFFAISGFILSYAFAKHFFIRKQTFDKLDLKSYYWRRITRLEPPFLISTLVLYFFVGAFVVGDVKTLLPNLFATLTYTHYIIFGHWSAINPVTWSLEVEIQFYIVAPFLSAALFSLRESLRNIILIILIIVFPLIIFYSNDSIFVRLPNLSRTVPVYFSHFMVGVLMASIYTGSFWKTIKNGQLLFDIVCVLSIVGLFYFTPNRGNLITYYLFDLCVLLIMVASFKGKIVNRFFTNSIITTIGGMCYSIYLIHYAALFLFMKMSSKISFSNVYVNYFFQMVTSITFVMFLSIIFYKYLEKPFMYKDWPQKFVSIFKSKRKENPTRVESLPTEAKEQI